MAELMLVNPRKRRRKTTRKRRAVAKAPVRRRRRRAAPAPVRRRRRNPAARTNIMDQVIDASVGAGGALAVDVAMANLPIPAQLTATPTMRAATQGAVSLGIGMLVANFGRKRKLGRQLAQGGLTVALHGMGKGMIGPTLGLSGYGNDLLGYNDLLDAGAYVNGYGEDMGAYVNGWTSPAAVEDPFYDNSDF